ncbi:MAG: MarR family winged helix-turn-helix transcriptional regulator [Acidithiobacillus sp.]
MTWPQFSVLTMIASYPGASGADLARLSLLTPQTVSVIVKNLGKAGWIARRPHDQHGRIQVLEITDVGKKLLLRCNALAHAAEARLMDGVGPADEQVIRRWLVTVACGIKDPGF